MTITLPPKLAVFVSYAVRTGRYPSELQMIFESLKLLSERDLATLAKPAIASTTEVGQTMDADTVFAEIEQTEQLAAQAEENAAKPVRDITTSALYHWVANSVDFLDLDKPSYARDLLVPLRDRLKALVQQERDEHEANLDDETRALFAKGEELLAREYSEEDWLHAETVRSEPWPISERPIYPTNYPPTLVDLHSALLERLDTIAATDKRSRDRIISRALWEYVYRVWWEYD